MPQSMRARWRLACVLVAGVLAAGMVPPALAADPEATSGSWSFGVIGDTQWHTGDDPAGTNEDEVAGSIISQVNEQMLAHGVKFVIQIGDLAQVGTDAGIQQRATYAQPLLDAGVGFFPVRGNHETTYRPAGAPWGTNGYGVPAFKAAFPQTRGLANTFGATEFSSPVSVSTTLDGLTYSFDYGTGANEARFVLIDNWATSTKRVVSPAFGRYGYTVDDQQAWITSRLDQATRGTPHAFVISHGNLIGENHTDTVFTGFANANLAWQNTFFATLADNDVDYYFSAHDHLHQRSVIESPDGASEVEQLIAAPSSTKFYEPEPLDHPEFFGQKARETSVDQELDNIGFYIVTVDGPRVMVDYYADETGGYLSEESWPTGPELAGTHITPTFNFVKKASWGQSANGEEFLVPGGSSLTGVADVSPGGTRMNIGAGSATTNHDVNERVLTKVVETGWSTTSDPDVVGDVLSLWGLASVADAGRTSPYVLRMSFRPGDGDDLGQGVFGIASPDGAGGWDNAVDANATGTSTFVMGPYEAGYGLGTYGVDPKTKTVWAVLDHGGDFAVANGIEPGLRSQP